MHRPHSGCSGLLGGGAVIRSVRKTEYRDGMPRLRRERHRRRSAAADRPARKRRQGSRDAAARVSSAAAPGHLADIRKLHDSDLKSGFGRVTLSDALAAK